MARTLKLSLFGALALTAMLMVATVAFASGVPRMTIEDLSKKLGDADIVVLDVRAEKDWNKSDSKIKGAKRMLPGSVGEWAPGLDKSKTYVLYCA